jgi:hypothetical protein
MTINFNEYSPSSFTRLNQARTPQEVARILIALSVSKSKDISLVYKELLRSVINKFSQLATIDEELNTVEIKCIHANPERAVAKLTQEDNLTLPIISVHQPTSKRDDSRQRYKPMVVSEKYWDDKKQRAIRLVSLVPSPIDIEYELTAWAKYKNDLDQITEQIHSMFNPDLEIVTPFATNIKLFIEQEQVDPSFIVGDREDRVLRRTFKIKASTYIPSPKFMLTSTGVIEELNYELDVVTESNTETFESFLDNNEEFMPSLFNASALFGYPIASGSPSSAGSYPALVWDGSSWSASDIFIQLSDAPNLLFSASSLRGASLSNSVSAPTLYDVLTWNGSVWIPSTVTATGTFVSGNYAISAGSAIYASAAGSSTQALSAIFASALLGSAVVNTGLTSGASLVWNGQVWTASALYLRSSEVPSIVTNASALLGSGIVASPVSGGALQYNGSAWVASSVLLKITDVTGLVMNASALLGSAINANPVLGAALTWNGANWAASDTYVKVADIAELTAKVDSVEWGARYYRPDFVKLSYVSQYGTGATGDEVEGVGSSDLWKGTSAYGEIARWFVPELSFRNQGIMEIDITGYFDASDIPTVANKLAYDLSVSSGVSGLEISGVTFGSISPSWGLTTGTWLAGPTQASATRVRREINLNSTTSSTILAGLARTTTGVNNESYVFLYPVNRNSSAINENSFFTVSGSYYVSAGNSVYKPTPQQIYETSTFDFVSSLICINQTGSAAAMETSSESFSLSSGDKLFFYRLTSAVSSIATSGANVIAKITLGTNIANATGLQAVLNTDPTFTDTAASALNLSATVNAGKVKIQYMGTDSGYEFGVVGTGARKLGLSPVANTQYVYSYVSKEDLFDLTNSSLSVEYTANLASAVAVFEIQMADDIYDDVLDYTDLPYGVQVSSLGYTVYDSSGNAYDGSTYTSALYPITYQAPPSSVGVPGVATRGFPTPWTTIATASAGFNTFTNIYSPSRNDFNINFKFKAAGFSGSQFYQPFVIEVNQVSGADVVSKKFMGRETMDFTKDKMMRVRFKSIQYSQTGDTVPFSDINSPYIDTSIGVNGVINVTNGENNGTYYVKLIPKVVTVTTLATTLSCPGDGHPF